MNKDLIVNCPTCRKSIAWKDDNAYKPFCSKRCKLIDLGEWASEGHKIAGAQIDPELIEQMKKQDS